jgi:protein involved in polysaccharide export with SLBB domain
VLVLGAVLLPGAYDYVDSATAWDAIALSGGAQEDALLSAVEIIPGEGSADRAQVTLDVQAAIQAGNLAGLPRLRPGDTVRVPRRSGGAGAGSFVFVFGAVAQQGAKPLEQAPDLVSLLVLSSPTPDAKLHAIDIVRRTGTVSEHIRVDARSYLRSANEPGNVPLRAGDTVYLERSSRSSILSAIGVVSPVLALVSTIIALSR